MNMGFTSGTISGVTPNYKRDRAEGPLKRRRLTVAHVLKDHGIRDRVGLVKDHMD